MAKFTKEVFFSDRYMKAFRFAFGQHFWQVRKNKIQAPYISHLMAVSSLVMESGGSEDEAIAALLHDSIEDVDADQNTIVEMFGQNVLNIILEVTEDKELPKAERKESYARNIKKFSSSALRVSVADKLHNIRGYLMSPELWGQEQKHFYDLLLSSYVKRNLDCYVLKQMQEIVKVYLRLNLK